MAVTVLMSSCKRACHYCTCTATAPFLQLVRRGRRASSSGSSSSHPRRAQSNQTTTHEHGRGASARPVHTRREPAPRGRARIPSTCSPTACRPRRRCRPLADVDSRAARVVGVEQQAPEGPARTRGRLRRASTRRRAAHDHEASPPCPRRPMGTSTPQHCGAGATTRGVGTRVGRRRRRRRPLRGGSAAHRATTATAVGVGARQGWWRQWHDAGGGAAARAAGRAAAPLAPRNVRRALRRRAARGVARRHPRGRQARLAVPHRAAPRRAKGARRLFDALYCMRHGSKALHVLSKLGEAGLGYSTQRSSNSKTWHQWRRLAGLPTGSSNSTTTRGGGPVRQPSTRLRAFVRVTTPR